MEPALFPEAQRGMVVESAIMQGKVIRVRTTGAEPLVNPADGEIPFHQRIGHPRRVATLQVGQPLRGGRMGDPASPG